MIRIVFGKPRVGKTAFMCANAVPLLNWSVESLDLFNYCVEEVCFQNSVYGKSFALPDQAPVYSNFAINVASGYNESTGSYYIDGFHMGFQNDKVMVLPVLPGSIVFLSEAQVYYNSRNSTKAGMMLPSWVTSFFEEHGHFNLDIWLDCQRPGLIDASIRELASEFVYIAGMENVLDKAGNVIQSRWFCKSFDDWKFAEQFVANGDERHCLSYVYTYNGNIFDCYESQCYKKAFVPQRNFALVQHVYGFEDKTFDWMYSQSAPKDFYGGKK